MITLRDLTNVMYTITHIDITARGPDGKYLHRWMYGPDIKETRHMYHDRLDGKLTIVDCKLNAHGDSGRGGSEIGWGVKTKLIPGVLLDAPIIVLHVLPTFSSKDTDVRVDVAVHPLEVACLMVEPLKESVDD